jgi:hypothetical protein
MLTFKRIAGLAFLLIILLTMTGCAGPEQEPTPDVEAIFTAAAQTVAADLTKTEAAKPTNTDTPQPTATIANTSTPGTPIPLPGIGTPLPGGALPGLSTATLPAGGVSTGDKCEWVSNDPVDGAVVDPKAKIDLVYTLKNSGTTTWTKEYTLRYYVGDKFVDKNSFNLPEAVLPNTNGRAIADVTAPSTAGKYYATFVLTNAAGVNFCIIDYTFTVGSTAIATAGGPTATKVSLAEICTDKEKSAPYLSECQSWCTTYCNNVANTGKKCYAKGELYLTCP